MIDIRNIRIGTRVRLRPGFGADAPILATITGFGEKRGRKLVDYAGGTAWAYLDQIDSILSQPHQEA
jgi:hypothetical protein